MQPKTSSEPPAAPPEEERPGEHDTWMGRRSLVPATLEPVTSAQDIETGKVIDGRYRVEALLGKGAVGLVYRCRHLVLDKDVAIKVLRPDYARDPEIAERLEVEAKAASAIGSPHIVETVDFGALPDGSAYFVMEYLEGRSLAQLLDAGETLGAAEVLHIATQIADALEAAHDAGIVHRDLKPDNVFIVRRGNDPYFVKILDFGIAKLARAESKLTRAGHIYGTPHYMSPEQATGRETDWRTDVYSLGVILYELVTSKVPFDADEPMAILLQHVHDEPPAMVPAAGGDLVPRLEAVVFKCLSKDPNDRYQNMSELRADLERLRSGALPEAVRVSRPPRASQVPPLPLEPSLLTRGAYVLAAAGVLASAVMGYFLFTSERSAGDTAAPDAPAAPPELPTVAEVQAAAPSEAEGAESGAAETAEAQPEGKPVLLVVLPADARITQNGRDLGMMPVTVYVPEGGRAEVYVERHGYVPRRLILKGDRPRVVIGLVEVGSSDKDAEAKAQAEAERLAAETLPEAPAAAKDGAAKEPPKEVPGKDGAAPDASAKDTQEAPKSAADGAAKDAAPKDAPADSAPKDAAPKDGAPKDTASKDPAPKDPAPKDAAPKDTAPQDGAPKDPAPAKEPPAEGPPPGVESIPAAPESAAPENAAPEHPAPAHPAPAQPAPPSPPPSSDAPPSAEARPEASPETSLPVGE